MTEPYTLFQPYWTQWCADTQALLAGLPSALPAGSPGDDPLGLKLKSERWLLELKVLPISPQEPIGI